MAYQIALAGKTQKLSDIPRTVTGERSVSTYKFNNDSQNGVGRYNRLWIDHERVYY